MWSRNCARIQTKEASRRLPWPEEFSSGASAQAGALLRLYSVCGGKQNIIGQGNLHHGDTAKEAAANQGKKLEPKAGSPGRQGGMGTSLAATPGDSRAAARFL
jgi:hypothetical protein